MISGTAVLGWITVRDDTVNDFSSTTRSMICCCCLPGGTCNPELRAFVYDHGQPSP